MHKFIVIIIVFFIFNYANGQNESGIENLINKIFISQNLEYLEILNDSILCSTLNNYDDTTTFALKDNSIIIQEDYTWNGPNNSSGYEIKIYVYPILKQTIDTIILGNKFKGEFKPDNWEDELVFVNLDLFEKNIDNFISIELNYSNPFGGSKKVEIDSLGKVTIINYPEIVHRRKGNLSRISGILTTFEFDNFIKLLEKSLIDKLPKQRVCGIDGARKDFIIKYGTTEINSTGCSISWIHYGIVVYLLELENNDGFLYKKKR